MIEEKKNERERRVVAELKHLSMRLGSEAKQNEKNK
jgi:hypothetical protein